MNDRFKFRIWESYANEMKYIDDLYYFEERGMHTLCDFLPDVIPMQCTGLKDKNGNLIYEGDILGGIYLGYIEYCTECKCFQLKVKDYGCLGCEGDLYWYDLVEAEEQNELEVIGNIYENKELLEEE